MEMKGGYPFYGDAIGILMLDLKAPLLPGNVGNAVSYDFPVRYKVIDIPADWWCDSIGADDTRCEIFIKAAKELEAEGVKAITTGCGYFAAYQERAAAELKIPIFASPLIMVPMVHQMLGKGSRVGIIASGGEHLKEGDFLQKVGIGKNIPIAVSGMWDTEEFHNIYVTETKNVANYELIEKEVLKVAKDLYNQYPDIGAFVFECSDLPPFAHAVAREIGVPVFDFISLAHLMYRAIKPKKYSD